MQTMFLVYQHNALGAMVQFDSARAFTDAGDAEAYAQKLHATRTSYGTKVVPIQVVL